VESIAELRNRASVADEAFDQAAMAEDKARAA
jgi:hypothetical protein